MASLSLNHWFPEVDGIPLKIRARETTEVEYDEILLRARLGDRYHAILTPDIAKIKRELPHLNSALEPFLPSIGSPSPDKVRAAIASGIMKKEEFDGAFTKSTRRVFSVSRAQPDHPALQANANIPPGG